jgi:thiamine pyrophosphate-dependent acetolactate synthase large subunit-like protein
LAWLSQIRQAGGTRAGDGGFMMSIADLETAIRLGLRMCILIYNDSSYAAEVHYFRRQGYSIDLVQFPETDFAALHAAMAHGRRRCGRLPIWNQCVPGWVKERPVFS